MIEQFIGHLKEGVSPIPMDQIFATTKATFAAIKSIQENGTPIKF
jgi:hypothetical protein